MKMFFSVLLIPIVASCSRTEPVPAQAAPAPISQVETQSSAVEPDELGLELVFKSSSEDFSSTETTVKTTENNNGITYTVSHVDGCGYNPEEPQYDVVGNTLELSYVLVTNMEALPASPCRYTSEFRFKKNPGGSKATFSVRTE